MNSELKVLTGLIRKNDFQHILELILEYEVHVYAYVNEAILFEVDLEGDTMIQEGSSDYYEVNHYSIRKSLESASAKLSYDYLKVPEKYKNQIYNEFDGCGVLYKQDPVVYNMRQLYVTIRSDSFLESQFILNKSSIIFEDNFQKITFVEEFKTVKIDASRANCLKEIIKNHETKLSGTDLLNKYFVPESRGSYRAITDVFKKSTQKYSLIRNEILDLSEEGLIGVKKSFFKKYNLVEK